MRKKVVYIIVFLIILLSSNSVYAINTESNYSKKYEEWLALPEEEREKTIPPVSFNVKNNQKNVFFRNLLKSVSLPSKYDLRDDIDIEVKNQMETGECWAFSANSVIETNLALKGENYEFSERHMEYETSKSFYDFENENALNRYAGSGGTSATAFTYYSRGSGPVLEDDMPFKNNENMISIHELPKDVSVKKVDDMFYFPLIYKEIDENGDLIYFDADYNPYTYSEIVEIRNQVKEHIMNYGGISIGINAPNNLDIYNDQTFAINDNLSLFANHAVTIIGWDDNYPKENFIYQPKENGAYIVLNSWGEEWGDNGIYYISYEDFLVESAMRGVTNVSDIEYDNLYQYDTSEMDGIVTVKYAANLFIADSDEKLTEVMIGSKNNLICNIYINSNGTELAIDNLTKIASNVSLKPGYNTIKFKNEISLLEGNNFAIIVEILGDSIGIGVDLFESNFISNENNYPNESFASEDGIYWENIGMANICIKAYTKSNNKKMDVKNFNGYSYSDVGGTYSFSIQTSYIERENEINVKIFDINNEDVTDKFEITKTNVRGNGAFIKVNCFNKDIEVGEYFLIVSLDEIENSNNINRLRSSFCYFTVNECPDNMIEIRIPDENFYDVIKTNLMGMFVCNDNELTISATNDVFDMLDFLIAYNKKIKNISGIEYFNNITFLDLDYNDITDITPLENLSYLTELHLCDNKITDCGSVLNNLNNLKTLDISRK